MKLYTQQVAHLTEMSEVPGSISGSAQTSVDIDHEIFSTVISLFH